MKSRATLHPRRWMLILVAALCAPCLAATDTPFESELARLAGRAARQCGIFALGKDGKDSRAGWQCALEADRAGQPYWFAFKGPGEDSTVGIAAIRTPAGTHILLDYDSDPFGGNGRNPRFTSTTCPFSLIYRGSETPALECGRPREKPP